MNKVIGIDISKQTFDVSFLEKEKNIHLIFSNDLKGFKKFHSCLLKLNENIWVVMEASGPYSVCLATYLSKNEIAVSVMNPLIIRRFSQMKFYRAKTDKKDASIIREYGELEYKNLPKWKPESQGSHSLKQMQTTSELLQKQVRQSKNQLSAFTSSSNLNKEVSKVLKQVIKKLENSIALIETQMLELC